MKPLKSILDIITGKRSIIKNNVGGTGMYLLNKMPFIESRKARTFFHNSIICSIADAFEYFLEIDVSDNLFYKNILSMTEQAGENFIKWETVYNTLKFTKEMSDKDEAKEHENALFFIFEFSSDEVTKYFEYKELLAKDEAEFVSSFSKDAVCDIFNITNLDSIDSGFIYNFYNNCYNEFYRSYTKYTLISLNTAKPVKPIKESDKPCVEIGQAGSSPL